MAFGEADGWLGGLFILSLIAIAEYIGFLETNTPYRVLSIRHGRLISLIRNSCAAQYRRSVGNIGPHPFQILCVFEIPRS